jgi:hypothetical protein
MTNIELFKKIIRLTNHTEFNAREFIHMVIDNPEVSLLNIKIPRDYLRKGPNFLASIGLSEDNICETNYPQGFGPKNINSLNDINETECCELLEAFEEYMSQLKNTLDGVSYTKGELWGTADIGLGDFKVIIRAGLKYCRKDKTYKPRIGLQFINSSLFNRLSVDNLMWKAGECTPGYLERTIGDYLTCDIPEHRWYHKPGDTQMKSDIVFIDRYERGYDFIPEETDGITIEKIPRIRDEIIRMRTIVEIMELTNPRLS